VLCGVEGALCGVGSDRSAALRGSAVKCWEGARCGVGRERSVALRERSAALGATALRRWERSLCGVVIYRGCLRDSRSNIFTVIFGGNITQTKYIGAELFGLGKG